MEILQFVQTAAEGRAHKAIKIMKSLAELVTWIIGAKHRPDTDSSLPPPHPHGPGHGTVHIELGVWHTHTQTNRAAETEQRRHVAHTPCAPTDNFICTKSSVLDEGGNYNEVVCGLPPFDCCTNRQADWERQTDRGRNVRHVQSFCSYTRSCVCVCVCVSPRNTAKLLQSLSRSGESALASLSPVPHGARHAACNWSIPNKSKQRILYVKKKNNQTENRINQTKQSFSNSSDSSSTAWDIYAHKQRYYESDI